MVQDNGINVNLNSGAEFQSQPYNPQNQSQDFLINMIRREMGIVFREIFQNPPPNQQVRNQTGRDYLWALMGNKQI